MKQRQSQFQFIYENYNSFRFSFNFNKQTKLLLLECNQIPFQQQQNMFQLFNHQVIYILEQLKHKIVGTDPMENQSMQQLNQKHRKVTSSLQLNINSYNKFYKGLATIKSSLEDILINYEQTKNHHSNSVLRTVVNQFLKSFGKMSEITATISSSISNKLEIYNPSISKLYQRYLEKAELVEHYNRKLDLMKKSIDSSQEKQRYVRNIDKRNFAESQYTECCELLIKNYQLYQEESLKNLEDNLIGLASSLSEHFIESSKSLILKIGMKTGLLQNLINRDSNRRDSNLSEQLDIVECQGWQNAFFQQEDNQPAFRVQRVESFDELQLQDQPNQNFKRNSDNIKLSVKNTMIKSFIKYKNMEVDSIMNQIQKLQKNSSKVFIQQLKKLVQNQKSVKKQKIKIQISQYFNNDQKQKLGNFNCFENKFSESCQINKQVKQKQKCTQKKQVKYKYKQSSNIAIYKKRQMQKIDQSFSSRSNHIPITHSDQKKTQNNYQDEHHSNSTDASKYLTKIQKFKTDKKIIIQAPHHNLQRQPRQSQKSQTPKQPHYKTEMFSPIPLSALVKSISINENTEKDAHLWDLFKMISNQKQNKEKQIKAMTLKHDLIKERVDQNSKNDLSNPQSQSQKQMNIQKLFATSKKKSPQSNDGFDKIRKSNDLNNLSVVDPKINNDANFKSVNLSAKRQSNSSMSPNSFFLYSLKKKDLKHKTIEIQVKQQVPKISFQDFTFQIQKTPTLQTKKRVISSITPEVKKQFQVKNQPNQRRKTKGNQ